MQDIIRHRTAFQERVIYNRTGRVVVRQFETPDSIVPYDIIVVAEGNKGNVPPIDPIEGEYTAIIGPKKPKSPPASLCA